MVSERNVRNPKQMMEIMKEIMIMKEVTVNERKKKAHKMRKTTHERWR